jgi:hypothetical protein
MLRSLSIGLFLIGALLTSSATASPSTPAVVMGTVKAADGHPLPYANVQLTGTLAGAATDAAGFFRFSTTKTGAHVLQVSMVGFRPSEQRIDLAPGDTVRVAFTLEANALALDGATVTADAYTVGGTDGTMGPLEAVTTPGAMGDLFRALQSFPGVAQAGDGAGLYVRGGDVTETKTLIDQSALRHPYQYESPTGESFGTIRPFLAEGTTFSTGGFSARYGNALSGVLAIDTKDRPATSRLRGNGGLAAVSLGLDLPLVDDRLGLRVSGNRSFTGLLFRLNGQHDTFATVPQGLDGTLGLTYDYSSTGQLQWFSFTRHSRMGIQTADGAFSGLFRNQTTNQLHSLQWTTQRADWTGRTSAAFSRYRTRQQFGLLDLQPRETAYQLRSDWERPLGAYATLRTGFVAVREGTRFQGTFPAQPNRLDAEAARITVDDRLHATRLGTYLELDGSLTDRLQLIAGGRLDRHTRAKKTTIDPRLAMEVRLSPRTRARLAWGRYRQFPALDAYAQHTGSNTLSAQTATHWIAALRHDRGPLELRLAGYLKPYRDLVVQTGPAAYANAGSGLARGADAFAKYGSFLETRLSGWVSYSFVQSRRTQPRQQGDTFVLERGPAPFDLTHQATLVGKLRVVDMLFAGMTYRHSTGRPVTPVVDAIARPDGSFAPVEGPVGSDRLPAYRRLDLQLSYYVPLGDGQSLTVYAAMNNAMDRANVTDVAYSPDYRTRTEQTTNFKRSVYAGLTVTL